ncbi:MAG: amidase [Pirellulales bacterium]|nr:amidase [Pirellulales bacterium]
MSDLHEASPVETEISGESIHSQQPAGKLSRRRAFQVLAGLGVGTVVFQRALANVVQGQSRVTAEMVHQAEWISGLELSERNRESAARGLNRAIGTFERMRAVPIVNGDAPVLAFNPAPWLPPANAGDRGSAQLSERSAPVRPDDDERLAFLPVTELAALLRTRKVTSTELTKLYLARLRKYDPLLQFVINYTDDLALKQAKQADQEIAAGRYRGPLHGIPWGAKDLIAVPGYPTTWGALPYRDQMLEETATVAKRLEEAGAVLLAKLSLGALAQGDRWYRTMTRNPWNPQEGSSGSSAGSSSAVAAGCVGFALGSETLGSIVSPSRRCGNSSLRPTFGRVSRYGCMTLSWTMDKIGPICRSIEDAAIVFSAIHGFDGLDSTAQDRPFHWPPQRDLRDMTVGYFPSRRREDSDRPELQVLKELGVTLKQITLPNSYPVSSLTTILNTEAAAAHDEVTRRNLTEGLNSWPGSFRVAQFTPAVEYLRANRIRAKVIAEMRETMKEVDLYVGGNDLTLTNLTGHPSAVLPIGFAQRRGEEVPQCITFTGQLFGETELLAVAHAYQQATSFHIQRPPLEKFLAAKEADKSGGDGGENADDDDGMNY